MPPIPDAKSALRKDMQRSRRGFAADAPDAGAIAARIIVENALVPENAVVAAYWPMTDEFDAGPLIAAMLRTGRRVVLPVTPPEPAPLIFRRYTAETGLRPARFGTHEPSPAAPVLVPTVLFVPLLAFDAGGRRLGYGGGYYDRTLAALRVDRKVMAYGLAFAAQELPRVPTDALDQPLDGIVTERGLRLFR